ncbi:MAG: hypothetical protein ACE5H9_01395 [Anaerolineae bacterium]
MSQILQKLKGGDLRSIGRAEEVVQDVLHNPALFGEVFEGLLDDDPRVRMRSADALEKVSAKHPEYLQPFKSRLIREIARSDQQEVRWHVAQMFSYLEIDHRERDEIVEILLGYIDTSESKIVKTFSMQTLADLAEQDELLRPQVIEKLAELVETGSPAMVSRGKKLIAKLEK